MIRRTLDFTPDSCFTCIHSYYEMTTKKYMCGKHNVEIGINISTYVCDDHQKVKDERSEPVQLKLFDL